jgi:hypothetical protein
MSGCPDPKWEHPGVRDFDPTDEEDR